MAPPPMFTLFFQCAFQCIGCRERPANWQAFPLCALCLQSLIRAPRLCPRCASPECLADAKSQGECQHPWIEPGAIESFNAGYLLLEPGYRILKRWKYSHGWNFDRRILDPDGLPVNEWREADIQAVVPIPQRWCRSWSLKGSPAEKIARWISRETGLPMLPTLQPADGPGRGLRQAQRRALDRISQPIRFEIDPDFAPTPGQRILLVDDFMTTGQTLQAAAAALRSHGAASVHAFCLGVRPRRGLSEAKANVFEHESVM